MGLPRGIWRDRETRTRDLKVSQGLAEYDAAVESIEERSPLCRDLDEDCLNVECKLSCWLHDPEQGPCPFLDVSLFEDF